MAIGILPPWSVAHRTPTSGCKQVGDDKVATLLSTTIEIPRNGYLCIYTSNETKNIDVYFARKRKLKRLIKQKHQTL